MKLQTQTAAFVIIAHNQPWGDWVKSASEQKTSSYFLTTLWLLITANLFKCSFYSGAAAGHAELAQRILRSHTFTFICISRLVGEFESSSHFLLSNQVVLLIRDEWRYIRLYLCRGLPRASQPITFNCASLEFCPPVTLVAFICPASSAITSKY